MLKETIRLNMNELPYLPPEKVIAAAEKGLLELNRYTNPADLELLRELLAEYSGVNKENIILGPGSDLLLREIVQIFSRNRKIVMLSPSFLPTVRSAKQFANKLVSIRLSPPDFKLNHEILINELNEASLLIIDNPNNPTGKVFLDRETVESILKDKNVLFVIDEAYYEFSGITFADMIKDCPNLAITRSMDKAFSLAGARIGYIIAGNSFLKELSSFYIYLPQSSLYAAREAMKNPGYMRNNIEKIVKEKERVWKELRKLKVNVYRTSTNFLLIKTEIPDIAGMLKDIGVLISDLSNQISPGFIRVSIGKPEENDIFIKEYMNFFDLLNNNSEK